MGFNLKPFLMNSSMLIYVHIFCLILKNKSDIFNKFIVAINLQGVFEKKSRGLNLETQRKKIAIKLLTLLLVSNFLKE